MTESARSTKVVIDTNLLLDDSKILFKLSKEYEYLILPITVLQELDKHKFKQDTSYSAREAIRAIIEFKAVYPDSIQFDTEDCTGTFNNDQSIINSAKRHKAILATKDMSMSIIAESQGVEVMLYDVIMNNIFNPYVYIDQEILYWSCEGGVFGYGRLLNDDTHGNDYTNTFELFERASESKLNEDAWFFVFIKTPTPNAVIYAHDPIKKIFVKIDDNPNYRKMRVEQTTIKARDSYQVCAIFALKEAPHCLISGRWGAGKTILATAAALSRDKDKKIFISRAPIGINSKYDLGYLPGDKMDKMQDWLAGFMSSLYYLYGNTRGQATGSKGYDFIKDTLFKQKFEPIAINSIQGLSLLDNDTLIVDEVQLIDVNHMSMILSRPSESGKLILLGDLKQTYNVVKPSESGLLKLLRILPHRSLAHVELQNSYRSDILELADLLQDKTIG